MLEEIAQKHTDKTIEVWFQDEARFGQQGTLTRVWAKRGRISLVGKLVEQEAVDAVAFATGANRVRIVRKEGQIEVRRPDSDAKECSYRLIRGEDPLGYVGKVPAEMLSGKDYPWREWLQATSQTEFPDLLPQIITYFDAPRAADLVVFAAPGRDLGHQWRAGNGYPKWASDHSCILRLSWYHSMSQLKV